jgi:hypothetical protein
MAVSPFDGVNRIRFKGSLEIADFAIVDCRLNSTLKSAIGNWIGNAPDSQPPVRLPRNVFDFQTVGWILGRFIARCKLPHVLVLL